MTYAHLHLRHSPLVIASDVLSAKQSIRHHHSAHDGLPRLDKIIRGSQ